MSDVTLQGEFGQGGAPIVESGSNANGEYVKYADGTMMCYKGDFTPTDLGGYYDWTLPAAFIDTSYYYHSVPAGGQNTLTVAWANSRKDTDVCRFRYFVNRCNVQAIGRWK